MWKCSIIALSKIPFPVIAVRGRSGSGKTTFITQIVNNLSSKGYKIAVIKHSKQERAEIDPRGKDTRKHLDSGASIVIGSFSEETIIFLNRSNSLNDILTNYILQNEIDLCILEGYFDLRIPNLVTKEEFSDEKTFGVLKEDDFESIVNKLQKRILEGRNEE